MTRDISFTRDELFEIGLLCQIGLGRLTVVDDNTLKRIWETVKSNLSDEDIAEIESLVEQELQDIEEEVEYDKTSPGVHEQVVGALERGNRLRIRYYAHTTGETTERVIRPYEIIDDPYGPYLFSYCELREAERYFRLDGIEAILEVLPPAETPTN